MSKKRNKNKKARKLGKSLKRTLRLLDNDKRIFGVKDKFDRMNTNMNKSIQFNNYIKRRSDEDKRQKKFRALYRKKRQRSESLHGYTDSHGTLLNNEVKKFQHGNSVITHTDRCICDKCKKKDVKITDTRLKLLLALRDSFNTSMNEANFLDKLEHSDQIYDIFKNKKIAITEEIDNIIIDLEKDKPKVVKQKSLVDKFKNSIDLNNYRGYW